MLAKARFEEVKIKGDADAEASRIRNEAHQKIRSSTRSSSRWRNCRAYLGTTKRCCFCPQIVPCLTGCFSRRVLKRSQEDRWARGQEKGVSDSKKGGPG